MWLEAVRALGGVGLFLVGMVWLTDGLRQISGGALRRALARCTGTAFSGALTGAAATAVVQSSSATTVTAVGFVAAGLLTFQQALGIIFGANIGTTVTGWIVAILGFKLDLGEIALPIVFAGVLLRLMGSGRVASIGTALAGFGLLFVGIEAMKTGLEGFKGIITPDVFPGDSLWGRLQLVGIGIALTVVTQSSSAGVATALAALGAGAINLPQAAAMVIGMDVGTTFTAALATLGGSVATRRTGLSHVIYNLCTGLMAIALLGPFTRLVAPMAEAGQGQVALVAFHSGFNILGVILVLPFAGPFAKLVMRLVPETQPNLTRHLDRQILKDAEAATDAAVATLGNIAAAEAGFIAARLGSVDQAGVDITFPGEITGALEQTGDFIEAIPAGLERATRARRLGTAYRVLDHLARLSYRCREEHRIAMLKGDETLAEHAGALGKLAERLAADGPDETLIGALNRLRRRLRKGREDYRRAVLGLAASGEIGGEEAVERVDAMRWMHRVSYHLWRIARNLDGLSGAADPVVSRRETRLDAAGE